MLRTLTLPIVVTAALSLAATPLVSRAETGATSDTTATPPPVSTPPAAPVALPATTPTGTTTAPEERPSTYTVVSGDSYWTIAQKFGCSVKSLKKINNAKNNNLKPGQVLKIPPAKGTTPTASTPAVPSMATPPTTTETPESTPSQQNPAPQHKHKQVFAKAQPVQAVDLAADAGSSAKSADVTESHAPVAKLVSPEELAADEAAAKPAPKSKKTKTPTASPATSSSTTSVASTPATASPASVSVAPASQPSISSSASQSSVASDSAQPAPASPFAYHSSKQSSHAPLAASSSPSSSPFQSSSPSDSSSSAPPALASENLSKRFLKEARELGDMGLAYDESWRPPGESKRWAMDCSNTSRYLYKVTTGLQLPRTASDQYYYLHLQNKAWDVPETSNGTPDVAFLRDHLKPGDLLFWKNTYHPERQPPITHVMIFLGTNDKGQWIMAGSQSSRGGEHNRRNGGPDIYVFDPLKPCGGYSTWLGLVRHHGSFCAFGRPLDADPAKLSVASN